MNDDETPDEFMRRARSIDRELKDIMGKMQQPNSGDWLFDLCAKEIAFQQDMIDRRVALEQLIADVWGTRTWECFEAPSPATLGQIPQWRTNGSH